VGPPPDTLAATEFFFSAQERCGTRTESTALLLGDPGEAGQVPRGWAVECA